MPNDEIQILRDHQRWLLMEVIPGFYRMADGKGDDSDGIHSVDSCLEQLFDIAYQVRMLEGIDHAGRVEKRKAFNANKRRVKQTFLPYENE